MGWALFALSHHPAATDRKHLPDKATRGFATKVRSKLSVFSCTDETPQGDLALEPLLKSRIALDLRRKVGGVINKVLRDCIH